MRPGTPALLILSVALAGCGGAGTSRSGSGASARSGHATLRVLWPQRGNSRLIPAAANSLVVTLTKNGTTVQTRTIARPIVGTNETDTTFTDLNVDTFDVSIKAYPTTDGTGTAQATGAGTLQSAIDNSGTVTISLASTVSTVEVTAASASFTAGTTTTLTASAKDADGNLVLLAAGGGMENLSWTSSDSGVATVAGAGLTATLTGVAPGSATITASFTTDDDGTTKTGSTTVSVETPGLSSTPAFTVPTGLASNRTFGVGSDSRLYIVNGSDNSLHAFSANGAPLWAFGGAGWSKGSFASADGNTVYFDQAPSNYGGKLYALNTDGTQRWLLNVPSGVVVTDLLEGSDGTIYFGNNGQQLYAANPDGTTKWTANVAGYSSCRPALAADGTIYVGTYSNAVKAVSSTGTVLWGVSTTSMPSGIKVGGDGTIYVSVGTKLIAYNADGSQRWLLDTQANISSTPVFSADGSTLYFGTSNGKLHAVDTSGTETWSFQASGSLPTSAIVRDGNVYFVTATGNVYGVNANGTQRWTYSLGNGVASAPVFAPNGTLYIVTQNGTIVGFR